jgi:hypothetical protein
VGPRAGVDAETKREITYGLSNAHLQLKVVKMAQSALSMSVCLCLHVTTPKRLEEFSCKFILGEIN